MQRDMTWVDATDPSVPRELWRHTGLTVSAASDDTGYFSATCDTDNPSLITVETA